jgi:predicted nucleic acid-binding protein
MALGAHAQRRADDVLDRIELVRLNNTVLNAAGEMKPAELRSLDAIHLATAALFETTLSELVTYDERMAAAARASGWTVTSPS